MEWRLLRACDYVFPAQAGMNRQSAWLGRCLEGVPRAGGDEPDNIYPRKEFPECSPRRRG